MPGTQRRLRSIWRSAQGFAAAVGVIAGGLSGSGLLPGMGLGEAGAQVTVNGGPGDDQTTVHVTNIVVPQVAGGRAIVLPDDHGRRRPAPISRAAIEVAVVDAQVDLAIQRGGGGIATTVVRMTLKNPAGVQQEAQVMVPVPQGAAVRSFGFDGAGQEPTAKLLPRDEARRIYDDIVRRSLDPALLEFVAYNAVRSSVFPVPASGEVSVSLTYEQVLERDGGRVDYLLPRSASLEASATKWTIGGRVRAEDGLATVYSPTHALKTTRINEMQVAFELTEQAATQPGALRLSCVVKGDAGADGTASLAATVMAYPDEAGAGGFFLLLAGVPAPEKRDSAESPKREVVVVLDRSGSMRGEKIDQARAAALQVVEGLKAGERFNIIDYSDTVTRFANAAVVKDEKSAADARAYLTSVEANGGTNLHDALLESLRPGIDRAGDNAIPMVLFLTDGLPTVGVKSELQIRAAARNANTDKRRVFTFGVGYDVNAPLLDHLAEASRGASINVLPGENVEVAVSTVFRRLAGPVMDTPVLTAVMPGDPAEELTRALRDVMPPALPDFFDGDQIVVLGRYATTEPLALRISGMCNGREQAFDVTLDPANATTRHSFIPRLWASRRIAFLMDQIRQSDDSAAGGGAPDPATAAAAKKELVDEIIALSTRWGILTEYTAFLATEPGGDAPAPAMTREQQIDAASQTLYDRLDVRAGKGGVNQSINLKAAKAQECMNWSNTFYDAEMNVRYSTGVRQVADRTLFCRGGNKWVEAPLVNQAAESTPDRTIAFGSDEHLALARQLAEAGPETAALLAVRGDVLLKVGDQSVLVKAAE